MIFGHKTFTSVPCAARREHIPSNIGVAVGAERATAGERPTHFDRVLRQARACLKRGWRIIAVHPKSKRPRERDWPHQKLTESDLKKSFAGDANIGVVLGDPSGGLVDLDNDCQEAIALARDFLPQTARTRGRTRKPRSHYFYVTSEPVKPEKFTDVDGTVLVELRSDGQQTIIPPSVHPSGERFKWAEAGDPSQVRGTELLCAVQRLAACALVARHWPKRGQRHDCSLSLAGALLRNGWQPDDAKRFITLAASASRRDGEAEHRAAGVGTTVRRLANGQTATGIPTVADLLGREPADKLVRWLGLDQRPSVTLVAGFSARSAPWPDRPADDAFQGLAGEIVCAIEPHSEADPVALLVQLLVAFGSAAGRKAHFCVEADRHFANLYAVLIGATSKGRKGTSLSHIRSALAGVDPEWNNNRVQSGLSSGEGLIFAVRDAVLRPARVLKGGRIRNNDDVCGDFGVDDKRLLVVEPEFAQPLKLMGREGNILSTVIRQAWDCGDLRTLTKNNPTRATGAREGL